MYTALHIVGDDIKLEIGVGLLVVVVAAKLPFEWQFHYKIWHEGTGAPNSGSCAFFFQRIMSDILVPKDSTS